jgi:hypothetical protein
LENEDIYRRISELEEYIEALRDRIRDREERIRVEEATLTMLEERSPGLTFRERMMIPGYASTFYTIRSLRGWQTRDIRELKELEAELERLKRELPPYRKLKVSITFSIDTGTGKEPFYAEVTCETIIDADKKYLVRNIANAVVKYFWVMFDYQKALKDLKHLKTGSALQRETYSRLVSRMAFIQRVATIRIRSPENWIDEVRKLPYEVREDYIDKTLKTIRDAGGFRRNPDEYVTRNALLKIGVEYFIAGDEDEPKYPLVYMLIEKGRDAASKDDWILAAKLRVADSTDIDIFEWLDMELIIEQRGR